MLSLFSSGPSSDLTINEQKDAAQALGLLLHLAQLQGHGHIVVDGLPILSFDIVDFLAGKRSLAEVMTDVYAWLEKPTITPIKPPVEQQTPSHVLPTVTDDNPLLTDLIHSEMRSLLETYQYAALRRNNTSRPHAGYASRLTWY